MGATIQSEVGRVDHNLSELYAYLRREAMEHATSTIGEALKVSQTIRTEAQ